MSESLSTPDYPHRPGSLARAVRAELDLVTRTFASLETESSASSELFARLTSRTERWQASSSPQSPATPGSSSDLGGCV